MKIKKIFEKLSENWSAKVLSFAFAIVLVQLYKSSLLEKRYFSVPLIVENSGNLVVAENLPRMVKVAIWGETTGIAPIREDDIEVILNISEISVEGEYRIPLQARLKGTAANISPLEIKAAPSELKVKLETRLSKRVNVKLSLKGLPSENYEIYETSIDPSTVEIIGPYSAISNTDDIFTNGVQIENRKTGFSGVIDILNPNPLIVLGGTSKIAYSVKIREISVTHTFDNVALTFENLNENLQIYAENPVASITVKGVKSVLSVWRPSANIVHVNCSHIVKPGIYTLPIQVTANRFEVLDVTPKSIQIEVKQKN